MGAGKHRPGYSETVKSASSLSLACIEGGGMETTWPRPTWIVVCCSLAKARVSLQPLPWLSRLGGCTLCCQRAGRRLLRPAVLRAHGHDGGCKPRLDAGTPRRCPCSRILLGRERCTSKIVPSPMLQHEAQCSTLALASMVRMRTRTCTQTQKEDKRTRRHGRRHGRRPSTRI